MRGNKHSEGLWLKVQWSKLRRKACQRGFSEESFPSVPFNILFGRNDHLFKNISSPDSHTWRLKWAPRWFIVLPIKTQNWCSRSRDAAFISHNATQSRFYCSVWSILSATSSQNQLFVLNYKWKYSSPSGVNFSDITVMSSWSDLIKLTIK